MVGTVVIIDDHEDIQAILKEVLEEEGYDVAVASDGKQGLRVLRSTRQPCVALLDLLMPVMTGYELMAAMRDDPYLSVIPVIVLSANVRDERELMMPGVAAVFRKPVDPYDLFKALEKVMPLPH